VCCGPGDEPFAPPSDNRINRPAGLTGRSAIGVFVLVHGDRVWRPVQDILEAAGHSTYAPSLTGYGVRTHLARSDLGLRDHAAEVVDLVVGESLSDIVLVGHSYGGLVITVAAEQAAAQLRHLVYVDALAPRDGESALDITPAPRRDEVLELARTKGGGVWVPHRHPRPGSSPGHPLRTLTDPVRLSDPVAAALPRTFVYCSSPPAPMIGPSAERARNDPAWRFHEFKCGHIVQHEAPRELADVLLGTV
jgi:pimeloyl-ACP methyl ester carboxylesterase